jgi:hypothetical protein
MFLLPILSESGESSMAPIMYLIRLRSTAGPQERGYPWRRWTRDVKDCERCLNKRDIDIENIEKGEEKSHPQYTYEEVGEGPNRDPI